MAYTIKSVRTPPALDGAWDDPSWAVAEVLAVDNYHPSGSDHRPVTRVRLLHDGVAVYVMFQVHDRYVRCVHTEGQQSVWKDSCVEFFVQPRGQGGYCNFECNCGGAMLLYFIEDPTPRELSDADDINEFERMTVVPLDWLGRVEIEHSMPAIVDPEITEPVTWQVAERIPFALLEHYVGPLGDISGQEWRANFYKCGDETSHPHFASWQPVGGDEVNFHQPPCFGVVRFE